MALDCCLGGSRRILRRHGATSTTGFWLPRRQRRRRCCPVPTGTANFGPIGRPAQAINDAGKHSRKKTIKMMMEQTNSAEGPSMNNVRPFLCHFYQPTFLLCPIIFKAVQNGSCQEIIRQLSQICQACISKVIRQLSGSCQTAITKLSDSYHKVVRPSSQKSSGSCQKNTKHLSSNHMAVIKQLSF